LVIQPVQGAEVKKSSVRKAMTERLISAKHLNWLACPQCQGEIEQSGKQLHCRGCGRHFPVEDGIPIMFPNERMTPELQNTLAAWNRQWKQQGLPPDGNIEAEPAYADALRHIRNHAPAGDWGIFLEAGCGSGRKSLVVAQEKKGTIIGVDGCIEACKKAKQLFEREGQTGFFVVGDLCALPLRAQLIGYIYAGGSLEHFEDTAVGVRESFRVLRPGGRITATVPFVSLANLIYAQLWGNIPDLPLLRPIAKWMHLKVLKGKHLIYGYEKSFTRKGFARYFQEAGFSNLSCGRYATHMEFQFLPWAWLKCWALWLAGYKWFWPVIYLDAERQHGASAGRERN